MLPCAIFHGIAGTKALLLRQNNMQKKTIKKTIGNSYYGHSWLDFVKAGNAVQNAVFTFTIHLPPEFLPALGPLTE